MSAAQMKRKVVKPYYVLVRYKDFDGKVREIHLNPKNVKRIYTKKTQGKCATATPIKKGDAHWKALEKKKTIGGYNNPHNGDVICFEDEDGKWYCVGEE